MRDTIFWDNTGEPADEVDVLVDAHGLVVGWGPGAERMLGYTADEVIGRSGTGLLHSRAAVEDLVRRCMADGGVQSEPVMLRHRSGEPLEVEVWARPLVSATGECQWLVQAAGAEMVRKYEFSRALLKGLFTDSPFYIDVFDTKLRFVAENMRAQRRAGVFWATAHAGHTMREKAPPGIMDMDAFEARQRQVLESDEALIDTEVRGHIVHGSAPREYVWSESILPLNQ